MNNDFRQEMIDFAQFFIFRMTHKLIFEDEERKRKVIDANVQELDRYEIYDPRNPLTKRRRENSKQTMKEKKHKT